MPDWLISLPPTIKLGLTLLSIIVLIRVKAPMWAAFLTGSGLLAILFPMSPSGFFRAVVVGVFSEGTAFIVLVVVNILVFSAALNETGQITRIIDAFRALVGQSRLTMVTFPLLIGMLPMPGGAIFSAPMVEAAVKDSGVSAERKTVANFWFRHVWEYFFPVYPGIILCLALTEAPLGWFVLLQLPMAAWALAIGYVVLLHGVRLGGPRQRNYSRENVTQFRRELTPHIIVISAVVLLAPLAEMGGDALVESGILASPSLLVKRWPILLGLALAVAWLFARRGLTWGTLGRMFIKKQIVDMVVVVLTLMVLRSVIESCGAVLDLRNEFEARQVSLVFIVAAVPFIAGLTVGLAFGFVGVSFPLILPLIAAAVPEGERLPWHLLAYSMGHAGMMLSPTHICLPLTIEYFKSNLPRVYIYLLPLGLSAAAASLALFPLYRMLFAWLNG